MMRPAYCEHDYALWASGAGELLEECDCVGLKFSREKEEALRAALEDARRQAEPRSLPFLNLTASYDEKQEKYYLVIKNMYYPRNLLETLYDRLIMEKTEDAGSLVDAYLGVIEEKEHMSLAQAREKLKTLAADMRQILDLYGDSDYSENELKRLADTLSKAYFDPIQELLEGVIVAIAGN